jgi:hypothetical protein
MRATWNKIVVRVNHNQKDQIQIADIVFQRALKFETNYRVKSPVMAEVLEGNDEIATGSHIICHHNRFQEHSAYHIEGDLYSIPCNDSIFLRIDNEGNPHSLFENIICERIQVDTKYYIPDEKKRSYHDRVRVISDGYGFNVGDEILTYNLADYEIVYHWQNQEKRIIKVKKTDIVAIIEK